MLKLVHETVTLQKHAQQPLNYLKQIDPSHHLSLHEKSGNYRYGNRGSYVSLFVIQIEQVRAGVGPHDELRVVRLGRGRHLGVTRVQDLRGTRQHRLTKRNR
jgi:hypothetical protein